MSVMMETHCEESFTSQQQANITSSVHEEQNNYYGEREVDSQAPPDLEPVNHQLANMVGEQGCYEPSADELIEVLKNLENLAAANPNLYKDIVSQIKDSQQHDEQAYYQQQQQHQEYYQSEQQTLMNGSSNQQYDQVDSSGREYEEAMLRAQYEEEMYRQQQLQQEEYHQQQQQQVEEEYQQQEMYQESMACQQQRVQTVQQVSSQETLEQSVEMTEDAKMKSKMERLEKEANEQVREALQKQREAKMAKMREAVPAKPKEITVIAGDGKAVKIMLGAQADAEDNRKQVAEAAGLKHIPLPDFDVTDSAWEGSLKRTERAKLQQGRQDPCEGGSPWAGSLRHVKERPRRTVKKDEDDVYGTAPWMGTLRHVVHDNKVTKNFGVNQFQSKRYPDEDATNPFEGQGGSHAKPAFPLTPAAIINGCALTRGEMAARDDASKIMEEILAMQVGLNVDQQADANEEADMIIRAIMQDEVGRHVYSKMADDLEAASQRRKKDIKKRKM